MRDPQRNLTGRMNGPAMRTLSPGQWVAERVAVSEELLWHKTCSQCHAISAIELQDVRIARWDAANGTRDARVDSSTSTATEYPAALTDKLPTIAPANIKLQWLPHARFDHDAHTGFSCASCHQNALTSTETAGHSDSGDCDLPDMPRAGVGYAESRCFECHTYHDWAKRKEVKPTFMLPGAWGRVGQLTTLETRKKPSLRLKRDLQKRPTLRQEPQQAEVRPYESK